MADTIRIGKVSSINYSKGMLKVVYTDRDKAVTKELPFISFNGEYKMPAVNDTVLVVHLSNGSAMGIVLGTFWSSSNKPAETGKGLFRKELAETPGEAFLRYDPATKTITIKADHIVLETSAGQQTF